MKRESICLALVVMIIISAVGGGVAFSRPVVNPVAPPMAGPTDEKTDLGTFTLNADGTLNQMPVGKTDWLPMQVNDDDFAMVPGYNIIRTFTNNSGKKVMLVINGNSGEAATFMLNNDASIGTIQWATYGNPLREYRCTNAEIYQSGAVLKLVTQDSLTGRIRLINLNQDGSPDLQGALEFTLTDMQDKNLFQIYYDTVYGYRMIGADTWSGKAVIYNIGPQKVADKDWTRGWTSMDHLYLNGITYRLLYKAAGDPYNAPAETSDQIGRLLVQVVGRGLADRDIQDKQIEANYTSVRFVEIPSYDGVSKYGVFCFRRTTGQYVIYSFDPRAGLGKIIDQGKLSDPTLTQAPPYIDVQPGVVNGKTFMAFISPDNARPIGYDEANAMSQQIDTWMSGDAVGYQFVLAQSGRLLHRRAWGKLKISGDPIDMTTHTQMEIASVSKMVTAMTMLKLAENGQANSTFSINDPIADHLPAGQAPPNSWATREHLKRLFLHTTGFQEGTVNCDENSGNSTLDCGIFFMLPPNLPCDQFNDNCTRSYNNANIDAARKVLENELNVST